MKFRIFFFGVSWWLMDPRESQSRRYIRCVAFADAIKRMDARIAAYRGGM